MTFSHNLCTQLHSSNPNKREVDNAFCSCRRAPCVLSPGIDDSRGTRERHAPSPTGTSAAHHYDASAPVFLNVSSSMYQSVGLSCCNSSKANKPSQARRSNGRILAKKSQSRKYPSTHSSFTIFMPATVPKNEQKGESARDGEYYHRLYTCSQTANRSTTFIS